jgi:hypothetical protein
VRAPLSQWPHTYAGDHVETIDETKHTKPKLMHDECLTCIAQQQYITRSASLDAKEQFIERSKRVTKQELKKQHK